MVPIQGGREAKACAGGGNVALWLRTPKLPVPRLRAPSRVHPRSPLQLPRLCRSKTKIAISAALPASRRYDGDDERPFPWNDGRGNDGFGVPGITIGVAVAISLPR